MMITANNGFIEQSERYAFDNAGESLKKYILLQKGELAYNHGASKLRPFGSCFALTTEELAAALLAVSCVTVTFCVNLTMVQDRANGTRKDFNVSPISKAQLYLGYFLSTVVNSLLVNGLALVLCLGYMYKMGWYMSAVDVFWVLLDEILLVLFGSTLSSIVSFPLTTQGQLSAVGTIVSSIKLSAP